MIAVISLADIPGVASAWKEYPQAEWELGVYALDPTRKPDPENHFTWHPLLPVNVAVHFHDCGAQTARQVCADAVHAVLHGVLPLEVDPPSREQWKQSIKAALSCKEH